MASCTVISSRKTSSCTPAAPTPPAERFASAVAFRDALTGAAPPPRRRARWQVRAAITAALVAVIATALVGGYTLRTRRRPSVAVLAFQNVGDDSANEPF